MSAYHHEDGKMRLLYEASYGGSVSTLNSLIQEDPLILFKISQTSFTETPLHISASLGHLDFTKALLSQNPKLALELDSSRSTPLHVASAEGHVDIVKELVQVNEEACLCVDEEGRIPLHYAAMRGRTEVVRELIRAKPQTLSLHDKGNTNVFQLCVTYNHLDTLKALVAAEEKFHDFMDLHRWNNILQLAIMLKQVEIVRYLLSIPKIRAAAESLEKGTGFTAFDILEQSPKDFKNLEIQLMLINSGIISAENNPMETPLQPTTSTKQSVMRKFLKRMGYILKHNDSHYLEEMRGNLSLVATVISTITFQALINPPGGFIQQGVLSEKEPFGCTGEAISASAVNGSLSLSQTQPPACPGEAISAIKSRDYFGDYLKYNTICFIASLSVTLLLVSGVPLTHKVVMWLLSMLMCVTLTFLALTYLNGLYIITPEGELFASARKIYAVSITTWVGLFGFVALFITLRFLVWLVKKCMEKFKQRKRKGNEKNFLFGSVQHRMSLFPRKGNENI